MRKFKYLFVTACAVFLCVMAFQAKEQVLPHQLNAATASGFQPPQLNLYDKVTIENQAMTVIETNGSYKFLADDFDPTLVSGQNLTAIPDNRLLTMYGAFGKDVFSSYTKLPAYADLSNIKETVTENNTTKETLNSDNIPAGGVGWWLSDSDANSRSGVTKDNEVKTTGTYKDTEVKETGCVENDVATKGFLTRTIMIPTKSEDFGEEYASVYYNYTVNAFRATGATTGNKIMTHSFTFFGADCKSSIMVGGKDAYSQTIPTPTIGKTVSTIRVTSNHICETQRAGFVNMVRKITDEEYTLKGQTSGYARLQFCSSLPSTTSLCSRAQVGWGIGEVTIRPVTEVSGGTVTCPARNYYATTNAIRPLLQLSSDSIVLGTNTPRTMNVASTINEPIPASDGIENLTIQTSSLSVGLDTNSKLVDGNTFYVPIGSTTANVPLTMKTVSSGTTYISAIANSNYGVLADVSGEQSASVAIDLTSLTKSADGSYEVTLYEENIGDNTTSYISSGTTIRIVEAEEQSIKFDENQIVSVEMGEDLDLSALYDGDVTKQAATNITFSYDQPSQGTITISNPSYDATTGKASAVFSCDGYVGDVTVKINKAGDSGYMPAEEKTITISVGKRAVKISAVVPDGIFKLNDAMPSLTRMVEGLDASDARIAGVTPYLEKNDPSYADDPAENGILKNAGSWKILLHTTNTLDTDLFDVTFVDFVTDNSLLFHVFEKDFAYYMITPNANSNGWNNTPVTISLSNEAKSLGYTLIEVINKNNEVIESGATIEYNNDIASITPVIRIRKGDTTTDATVVREIKIDLKKPTAEVAVDNVGDWAQKKTVTITANDALSGVASVSVSLNGTAYTVTQDSVNLSLYTFEADKDGTYDIVVSDEAGNTYTTTQEVDKIDASTVALSAVPETLTGDQPKQKITLTFDAGTSGIDTFKVYYKGSNDTEYKFYKNLDTTIASPYDFDACMNGSFKFELINKAGASAVDIVNITQVNPPKPVTKIDAAWEDDATKAYTSNTWTNQNIRLTLSNINPAINGDIIWQISTNNGVTWTALDGNTKLVSTDAILNESYLFKAKIGEVEEEENQSFTVKIDKTKPAMPVIDKHEDYTADAWFENGFTLTSSVVAKENNASIGQDIYVCDGTKADCKDTPALWKKTNNGSYAVSGNGKHELYFKTIDEAGNESEITAPAYINLNNTAPVVTIKLNENKLKDLLQTITLGFFFKDTVDIKFDVEYGFDSGGTLKYIVDKNADRTTPFPDESDPRWTVGTSDTLTPDGKAMIYVIATSKAGVITKESSQYNVYADKTPPVITIPDTTAWSKDTTLEVEITDATAGVDASTVQYKIDQGSYITGSLVNDKLSITGLADGIYDIRINASDHSGNRLAKDAKTTVHIDSTAPVIGAIQAEKTGWINEQTITFSASDAVSDLAGVPVVKNSKNKTYTVVDNEDGTYSCTIDKNDTYTISVKDNAGNETTATYVEAYIDTEPPVISNIVIDHANDWKASKKVSFDVIDADSDVDYVVVSYVEAGVEKQVNVSGPVGDTFSFTATQDGEYTITAYDKAGNSATETVTVEQIDPDGLKIINISDTSAWAKDQMIVRFEVQTGNTTLKADFPKVTLDGNAITVTKTNDVYSFIATQNGTYTITAENDAADSVSEELVITKIDTMKPMIKDISNNTTSSTWREPVDISFHVYDYNSVDESSMGSGMKAGYPNVYIMLDGNRTPIQITQDANDSSLFTFTAEYNTTYIVEAMDAVGHDIVEEHIVVDHILGKDIVSDIVVLAENDGTPLASGTWAKGEILFTISGGLDAAALEKYQVAITQNGVAPVEADWQDLNLAATHQHKVTGNVNGDSYWFRALPSTSQAIVSDAFVVRLDNAKPENLTITLTPKNTNAIASFVNTLTFGQWLNREQEVSFSATDNFTAESDLRFEYAEKVDGVMGAWKKDTGSLSYADTNIELYARAIDLAGNISKEEPVSLSIDTLPPIITGVKNQKEYK